MWPPPGPYTAPLFQPAPPTQPGGYNGTGYGRAPLMWITGGYMAAFVSDQSVPFPLVTTSSPNQGGLLGAPTTIQLFGAQNIRYSLISGFQLDGGFWGDCDRRFGFDMSLLYTMRQKFERDFTSVVPGLQSVGIPLLARPFFDTSSGLSSLIIASPTIGPGIISVTSHSEIWGIDPSGIWNVYRSSPGTKCWMEFDLQLGYKFYELREDLAINSAANLNAVTVTPIFRPGPFGVPVQVGTQITPVTVPLGGVTAATPSTVSIGDRFAVSNQFNGGYAGFRSDIRYGMLSFNLGGKIGIGNMHEVLDVTGATSFVNTATGQTGSSFGGLYANPTNIGHFSHDEFAVIPEVNANVALNLTKHFSIYVGYNFLYINRVARPGDQLNPVIDASTVPFSPTFGNFGAVPGASKLFVQNHFYLHGINFGFDVRY
jgi:hypothetical protein